MYSQCMISAQKWDIIIVHDEYNWFFADLRKNSYWSFLKVGLCLQVISLSQWMSQIWLQMT